MRGMGYGSLLTVDWLVLLRASMAAIMVGPPCGSRWALRAWRPSTH